MGNPLAAILNEHLVSRRWSFKKLAKAAELHPNTVYNWTRGAVSKVHQWQHLAKAARALELDRDKTNALLAAGGQDSLHVIAIRVTEQEDRELLAHWPPPPPPSPMTASNLPQPLTSFVGRQEELAQIITFFAAPGVRLLTLTGPGGSGKTRLAIEAAQEMLEGFDGVYFVELAVIHDPDLVIHAISQTLGLSESPEVLPLQSLAIHLRDRRVLLVLDNFEQVIEAAPLVARLLRSTRGVKALVTSRTRLHVRGEHEIAVPPLPLPGQFSNLDELTQNSSVVLFADRARAVDGAFTLTPMNTPLVAAVCARLDGLPLAIELAAARTRQVGLRAMRERIPSRLALAHGGPRDVPDRQRTLRATIAWSYDLLKEREKQLFTCLSVFAGGVTVAAAESVCAALGLEIEVPESLESLVDQNLLRRSWGAEDESRYEMLETVREYSLEMLAEHGQADAAQRAHADYYLTLAERAQPQGNGSIDGLNVLANELDNVRAALDWCREQGDGETGLRLCLALMPLWHVQDHLLEAHAWLETFMAAADHVSPNFRARGLLWQGLFQLRGTGDVDSASRLFEEALALFRNEKDLNGASEALQAMGDAYRQQEDWVRAHQVYLESLELAEQTGSPYLVSHGYMGLAFCAQEVGEFDDAQENWELTRQWAERSGHRASIVLAVNSLGEMARYRGDWEEAAHHYKQTLKLAVELGSEFRRALALHNLGYVALHSGDAGRAKNLFTESLLLYEDKQYRKGVAECLAGLASVEAAEGRLERAARLGGASETILNNLRTRLDALDRADYERTLATLECQLGERLEPLLDEGRAMSLEMALEYAVPDRHPHHR